MNRKQFIRSIALLPLISSAMKLHQFSQITNNLSASQQMPVLFLGHGSPMNAIEENEFVSGFRKISETIQKPNAILCISAHWETKGTFVTAMQQPQTIHDFGGFPKALFDVQYPAPGSPQLALETKAIIKKTTVAFDTKWGLDHGAWSVIKHLYPKADVPVIEMSIDYSQSPQYHYDLAKELASLRMKGVLIIGSGNMVHNLGLLAWDKLNEQYAFDWAIEANEKMKSLIEKEDHKALINFKSQGKAFDLAIPSPEHFIPLLYVLALKEANEKVLFFNDKPIAGSLSMTSLKIQA